MAAQSSEPEARPRPGVLGYGHMLLMVGLAMMATGSVLLKKIVSFRG